jgi:cytochrome c553
MMKCPRLTIGLAAALWIPLLSCFADTTPFPDWAYPISVPPPPSSSTRIVKVAGSTLQVPEAALDSNVNPPDWFPETHPPMPSIVAHGRAPAIMACAKCHLPNGAGHPESADLAALPVAYFKEQLAYFRSGARHGLLDNVMHQIALALTESEADAAARYYAGLHDPVWNKIVETDTVPLTEVKYSALRLAVPGGGQEALGHRIISLPLDEEAVRDHAQKSGFVSYVPVGSIARGKTIVETGDNGRSIACATCHGEQLLGLNGTPHIAGRSPIYVFRQLNDLKTGRRGGDAAAAMIAVVANLSQDDMIDIAAYLATLNP